MLEGVARNREGLSDRDVENCQQVWVLLGGDVVCPLDVSSCRESGSKTAFVQAGFAYVRLGADVLPDRRINIPDVAVLARTWLSLTACLAHELAHAERYLMYKFDRTIESPDHFLDEAETSIHASHNSFIEETDRHILIEDARDCLQQWLNLKGKS